MEPTILGIVSPRLDSFLIQILSTFVLYLILRHFLYKPVSAFMEERRNKIQRQLKNAEDEEKKALHFKEEYESKIKDIQTEADQIMIEARKRAASKEAQLLKEAEAKAADLIEKARKDIALEQERMRAQIKEEIIDIASQLAHTFVAKSLDQAAQQKVVNDFIQEVGDVKWLS